MAISHIKIYFMKIFHVTEDSNHVQLVDLVKDRERNFCQFNCEPKFHEWKDTEVYIYNPKVKIKNFYGLISGILVFDQRYWRFAEQYLKRPVRLYLFKLKE